MTKEIVNFLPQLVENQMHFAESPFSFEQIKVIYETGLNLSRMEEIYKTTDIKSWNKFAKFYNQVCDTAKCFELFSEYENFTVQDLFTINKLVGHPDRNYSKKVLGRFRDRYCEIHGQNF
ncbi:hypothetical protein FACS1894166_13670 [Bacilli bacterium]|nr:hypothetical protein FACS1894166_13670 [Bacilli bacterium]